MEAAVDWWWWGQVCALGGVEGWLLLLFFWGFFWFFFFLVHHGRAGVRNGIKAAKLLVIELLFFPMAELPELRCHEQPSKRGQRLFGGKLSRFVQQNPKMGGTKTT